MMIRALQPSDRELFETAYQWREGWPKWLREAEKVWGVDNFEEFYELANDPKVVDFGVFDPDFAAIISVTERGAGIFEGHLYARPKTPVEMLGGAVEVIRRMCFERGAIQTFVWTAKVNRPVKRICELAGFRDSGVTVIRGKRGVKSIEWKRYQSHGQ